MSDRIHRAALGDGKGYAEPAPTKGYVTIDFFGTITAADTKDMAYKLLFLADVASGAEVCEHGRIKSHCVPCIIAPQLASLPEGFVCDNQFVRHNREAGTFDIDVGTDVRDPRYVEGERHEITKVEALNLVAWLLKVAEIDENELRLAQDAIGVDVAKNHAEVP